MEKNENIIHEEPNGIADMKYEKNPFIERVSFLSFFTE
jgi:hypothetical protein